jgi:hypothetical protein
MDTSGPEAGCRGCPDGRRAGPSGCTGPPRRAGSGPATRRARSVWGAARPCRPTGAKSQPCPSPFTMKVRRRDGVVALRRRGRAVGRRLGRLEVSHVVSDPLLLLLVPPDVLFPLCSTASPRGRPRRGCRGRGGWPAMPSPTRAAALGCSVQGFLRLAWLIAVGEDAAVDPPAARRRAVVLSARKPPSGSPLSTS